MISGRWFVCLPFLAAACAGKDEAEVFPDGPRNHVGEAKDDGAAFKVRYRGGPVLHHPKEVHVYWGSYWRDDGAAAMDVLDGFAASVGASTWYKLTREYPDGVGAPGAPDPASAMVADDPAATVSDREVRGFLQTHLDDGTLEYDPEAVYFVFTPPGTVVYTPWGKTCGAICGYHFHFKGHLGEHDVDVKYGNIPYGACPKDCGAAGVSANGPALDQMTVTLSHELAEAVTDPDINAWTGPRGEDEIGDLCDRSFVATWAGARYALQEIWSNAALACARR